LEVVLLFFLDFDEMKKGHYEILGIPKTAGEAEIKQAYFKLVRKYQPDRFPEEFKEIRAAYEILSDRQKRAEYDAFGELPPSVIPPFREAQRLERFGRRGKAAELYKTILKAYPELDSVREKYAKSLSADNKTGKAAEVWEELCRRHPENPYYAGSLGENYLELGWNKKAHAELRRALALDRSSVVNWSLLISCTTKDLKNSPNRWDELDALCIEAIEAVKEVKVNEWEKIHIYTQAFLTTGLEKGGLARNHLREIIRLIREGGRNGQDEGMQALKEILLFIPGDGLAHLYPELREMADLLPGMKNYGFIRGKLDNIRLNSLIEGLVEKKFSEIFRDLFRILNADIEEDGDELDLVAIEHTILNGKSTYDPQLRRLKEEFPELYALHGSFFNEALRTRNVDKMLYQREKKYKKLKRRFGIEDEEDSEAPPSGPIRRAQPKVGRNDPCPCGSGKKYKHCCGA
jgi:curved DNA-binding protein CbpA